MTTPQALKSGLDGPSRTIILDPVEEPAPIEPEPGRDPEPAKPPEREPDEVPA